MKRAISEVHPKNASEAQPGVQPKNASETRPKRSCLSLQEEKSPRRKFDVFLAGTCANSTWRQEIVIPSLEAEGISVTEEEQAMQQSGVILVVITEFSPVSFMEAYSLVQQHKNNTQAQLFVLCIPPDAEPDLSKHDNAMSDLKELMPKLERDVTYYSVTCERYLPYLPSLLQKSQNAIEAATQLSQEQKASYHRCRAYLMAACQCVFTDIESAIEEVVSYFPKLAQAEKAPNKHKEFELPACMSGQEHGYIEDPEKHGYKQDPGDFLEPGMSGYYENYVKKIPPILLRIKNLKFLDPDWAEGRENMLGSIHPCEDITIEGNYAIMEVDGCKLLHLLPSQVEIVEPINCIQ